MTRALVVLALLAPCGKKQDKPADHASSSSTSAAPAGLPAFELKPVGDDEAKDIATLKLRTQHAVAEWLSEETTSDGWILTYSMPHKEYVQGNDDQHMNPTLQQTGLDYGVYVRRTIDGKPYKCVTTHIEKREDIARVVAACKTAQPK